MSRQWQFIRAKEIAACATSGTSNKFLRWPCMSKKIIKRMAVWAAMSRVVQPAWTLKNLSSRNGLSANSICTTKVGSSTSVSSPLPPTKIRFRTSMQRTLLTCFQHVSKSPMRSSKPANVSGRDTMPPCLVRQAAGKTFSQSTVAWSLSHSLTQPSK